MLDTFETETEWLLHNLWNKPQVYTFKIPDTIILKNNRIENWYFASANDYFLKKNKHNLNVQNISQKFTKKLQGNFEHVAANAYHFQQRKNDVTGKLKSDTLTLEHISTHDFPNFAQMIEHVVESSTAPKFKIP